MKAILKEEIKKWEARGQRRNKTSLKRCQGMMNSQRFIIENANREKIKLEREYLLISLALEK